MLELASRRVHTDVPRPLADCRGVRANKKVHSTVTGAYVRHDVCVHVRIRHKHATRKIKIVNSSHTLDERMTKRKEQNEVRLCFLREELCVLAGFDPAYGD